MIGNLRQLHRGARYAFAGAGQRAAGRVGRADLRTPLPAAQLSVVCRGEADCSVGGPADFGCRRGEDITDDERCYRRRREVPVELQITGAGVAGKV